jgi:hypothetical protein
MLRTSAWKWIIMWALRTGCNSCEVFATAYSEDGYMIRGFRNWINQAVNELKRGPGWGAEEAGSCPSLTGSIERGWGNEEEYQGEERKKNLWLYDGQMTAYGASCQAPQLRDRWRCEKIDCVLAFYLAKIICHTNFNIATIESRNLDQRKRRVSNPYPPSFGRNSTRNIRRRSMSELGLRCKKSDEFIYEYEQLMKRGNRSMEMDRALRHSTT